MNDVTDALSPNRPAIDVPSALPPEEIDRLTDDIIAALKTVYDPEIPSDIYELGLVYRVDVDDDRNVAIDMTLTAPGCPVAGEMPGWVENAVAAVPGRAVGQGHHGLRSAVGPEPHVGRGPRRARHVVKAGRLIRGRNCGLHTPAIVVTLESNSCPGLEPGRTGEDSMGLPQFKVMSITDAAAERVRSIVKNSDKPLVGVRVGVRNGGCAGMSYTLDAADSIRPGDEVVEEKGVTVLVDPKAVLFLLGTEMDFATTKLASQFVFNNPNQTSACGCGESVALTAASPDALRRARLMPGWTAPRSRIFSSRPAPSRFAACSVGTASMPGR